MNREQAHIHLGLYVGATREHIEEKVGRKRAELQRDLQGAQLDAALKILEQARMAALDERPSASTPTVAAQAPRRLFKGWWILLVIALALGVYTIVTFAAGDMLDSRIADRTTDDRIAACRQARDAWEKYRLERALPPNDNADKVFADAELTRSNGNMEEALTLYEAAEGLYIGSLRGEGDALLRRFDNEVRKPWREKVATSFPFDPAAEADAPVEEVERILNPKSGVLWTIAADVRRLAEIEIGGRIIAPVPAEFTRTVDSAAGLRDALFDDGAGMQVKFSMRLVSNTRYRDLVLELGTQVVRSGGETFTPVTWRPSLREQAQIMLVTESPARDPSIQVKESDSPWGMLRILWRLELVQSQDGLLVWHFDNESVSRRRPPIRKPKDAPEPLVVQILADKDANPFEQAIFARFAP